MLTNLTPVRQGGARNCYICGREREIVTIVEREGERWWKHRAEAEGRACQTRQQRVRFGGFDKVADVEENSSDGGDVVIVHA